MKKLGSLGLINVIHNISMPSKISDYDYDPTNIDRRFISTYLHTLTFLDAITGIELISFSFDSLLCADMISDLYELSHKDIPVASLSISNIHFSSRITSDGRIVFTKIQNQPLRMGIFDSVDLIVSIEISDIDSLIETLNTDEIEDMFINNSDDRW